jgi:DNA-binding SARP family transcriptional activator
LGRLAAEEPLRERRRAQLMLALYRSGQQADALRVYREAHAYLADELGLEPGRELRALELAVVNHDPSLAPPTVAQPSVPARRGPARRRGPPRLRLIGALVGFSA